MPKLLVWLKPQYLGDAVMAAPLLDAVAHLSPDVLAGPLVQQVLGDRADRVRFLPSPKLGGLAMLRAARELRGYDQVLLVNRSFRTALASWLARIPIRVGHRTEGRGFLLTHGLPYQADRYEAECYLDLWRALGHEAESRRPTLKLSPEELEEGRRLASGATIGLQPGARYEEKQYPLEQLAEVASALQAQGRTLVLLGGPDEREAAASFAARLPKPPIDLVGSCSIRQTMGVLGTLDLTIGSDTGLMHLAVGVGCPTVTIFGPNPASKWGHATPPHRILEAPEGVPAKLPPSDVLEAAAAVLDRAE